jgi:branched-chain amino acid transport system permease protein
MASGNQDVPASEINPEGAQALGEDRASAFQSPPPERAASFYDSLKDAGLTALLAAVLGFFFIGLRTELAPGGLDITTRWRAWIISIVIVFVARMLLNIFFFKTGAPKKKKARAEGGIAAIMPTVGKVLTWVLFAFAVVLPFFFTTFASQHARQYIDMAILIMTYIMLGWGLNIVVGLAGLLDLGYVAFYAVGAYSFALLAHYFHFGFWEALPLAGILAATWGIILGFPVLRLRGDYLAIVTLAFGEIVRVVIINWYSFTNGPNGISGIPKPTVFGWELGRGHDTINAALGVPYDPIQRFIFLYYIIFVMALITNFITIRLRRLPIGRAWEALREDEIACRSLGINTRNTKLTAFAIGAMFGGFAGSFFATRQGFVSPESFTFLESAIILSIVVLGGLGSQLGVVLAAVVMIGGTEMLRNLDFLKSIFGDNFDPVQYRMLIFGLAMVIIMVWKPRGLIATRTPSAVYKEKKKISADLVAQGEGHG